MTEPQGFKGTPGEWSLGKGENTLHEIVVTTPRGLTKSIARVGGYGGDARQHNARLMANSKRLLAALQTLMGDLHSLEDNLAAAKEARAAIAAALGEDQS